MADAGTGVTITFSSGFCAEIRNVDPPRMNRPALETTHSTTSGGKRTFIPSDLTDMGEASVDLLFNPSTDPPIDAVAETVTITYPIPSGGMTAATWAFSGFMTDYSPSVPYDDIMTATATLKVSGDVTVTAGT